MLENRSMEASARRHCRKLQHQLHAKKTSINYGYHEVTEENIRQGRAGTEGS